MARITLGSLTIGLDPGYDALGRPLDTPNPDRVVVGIAPLYPGAKHHQTHVSLSALVEAVASLQQGPTDATPAG